MFSSSKAGFDRLLDKATSQLLLDTDWDSILQICDAIRQEDVQPKYAIQAMKKKMTSDNPHVVFFALQVLESSVKNCGSPIHCEIATKEFMEFMKELLTKSKGDMVKQKVLELIQIWSQAFRKESSYRIVQDTFNILQMEGHKFPAMKEADAMFTAEKAPEWKEGDNCHRCRVAFTTFNRKHHCRCCGEVFCSKCSSKNSIIPKFGIEREVRVCETCFDQLTKANAKPGKCEDDLPTEYVNSPLAKQPQQPAKKTEEELREEEELQLALALSQSEAEEKEKQKKRMTSSYATYSTVAKNNSQQLATTVTAPVTAPTFDTSEMDPELARYLNRNYWQQKVESSPSTTAGLTLTQPSAPAATIATTERKEKEVERPKVKEVLQNGESNGTDEQEQFLGALQSSIEIFVNRMKSDHMRGRSIANDSAVQTLFLTLNQMHPQLLTYIDQLDQRRGYYESLQDKLAQLKDAREALDVLRDEHQERRRREQEEMERQRAIAMAHKLEVLRQKKHEYLEFQRQLALQRMLDQEMEMKRRLEEQKMLQMQRGMQYTSMPYGTMSMPPQMPAGQVPTHQPVSMMQNYMVPNDGSPRHQPYNVHMQAYPGQQYHVGLMGPESLAMQHHLPANSGGAWPAPGMQGAPMSYIPASVPADTGYQQPQYSQGSVPNTYPQSGMVAGGQNMYISQPPVTNAAEYNMYNMQGMSSALPTQMHQQHPGAPAVQYPGPAPDQQPGWGDRPQQYITGPGPNHGPAIPDSQLISFD